MQPIGFLHAAWTIARKDATETWRDGRFRWAAGALVLMLAVAFASGWSHATTAARARAEAQRAERDMWLDKGPMNPHAAAHYGAFVFKPVSPLSAIDPGLDPYLGAAVFLEAHQQDLSRHGSVDDASPLRRFATLTPALVLQLLTPLLIVLATAPAFAAERTSGTLRQLLSLRVSRLALALGKVVGTLLPIAVILGPLILTALIVFVWTTPAVVAGDVVTRAVLLAVVYIIYFAIWAALGLWVSTRATSATSSLAILLTIWCAWALVYPSLALQASRRDGLPSSGAFVRTIEEARTAFPRWDRRVEGVEERFLSGALVLEPGMPSNPEVIALVEAEADETALYDRELARLFTAYGAQARRYAQMGVLAPPLALQAVSMALAGTDYAQHHDFLRATGDYRRAFLQTLNAELASYQQLDTFDYTRGREFWQRIPAFSYEAPDAGAIVTAQRPALFALVIWLVIVMALLGWGLSTMRAE